MKTAQLVFGGSLIAGTLATAWFVHERMALTLQRDDKLEARIAALEGQRPERIERIVERPVRVEVPGAANASARVEANSKLPAETSRRTFTSMTALAEAYAEDFAGEPIDFEWARSAEEAYLPAVQAALSPSSRLVAFECRSSFCAAEVVHASIEVSNAFLLDLFAMDRHRNLAASTRGFRVAEPTPTADGALVYKVYIARRGVMLAIDPPLPDPGNGG